MSGLESDEADEQRSYPRLIKRIRRPDYDRNGVVVAHYTLIFEMVVKEEEDEEKALAALRVPDVRDMSVVSEASTEFDLEKINLRSASPEEERLNSEDVWSILTICPVCVD